MQGDLGSHFGLVTIRKLELALTLGRPLRGFRSTCTQALHHHLVRNDEGGIKPDTELADHLGIFCLIS